MHMIRKSMSDLLISTPSAVVMPEEVFSAIAFGLGVTDLGNG